MWVGISAVGVFRSEDGGDAWTPVNEGVEKAAPDERAPDIGFCVHGLAADPSQPDTIWRQDHMGVYRTTDGGDHWEKIERAPRHLRISRGARASSGRLFVMPLEGGGNRTTGGRLSPYVSTDGGDSWHLPVTVFPTTPSIPACYVAPWSGTVRAPSPSAPRQARCTSPRMPETIGSTST